MSDTPSAVTGVYAKSSQGLRPPELLTDHLHATRESARALGRRVGAVAVCTAIPGGLWPAVEVAALTHDLGKVASGFQDMLAGRIRVWPQRHELLSLGFLPPLIADAELRLWIASAVLTHHRPLAGQTPGDRKESIIGLYGRADVDEMREELGAIDDATVAALHAWICAALPADMSIGPAALSATQLITNTHAEWRRVRGYWDRVDPEVGLAAVLLQGALTFADHLASAHGDLHQHQPIAVALPDRLARRFDTPDWIRPHQQQCATVDGHLLLRSPTGSGKTEAGLLWAAGQVRSIVSQVGGVPRVFVTLPYLASINAMVVRLGSLLGDADLVGVAHSRAASYHLAVATGVDDGPAPNSDFAYAAARKAVSRAAATRLFRETVRVATPYQLLRAALAGPAHSSILLDLANSVIVLDELHAYDTTRLGYILASAGMWERLGCRLAVLSATLPAALAELVSDTLKAPVVTVIGPAETPRHRIRLRHQALTDSTVIAEISERIGGGESVLVVANNVAHAQHLFAALAPAVRNRYGHDAATLLHSRFKRGDRNRIEQVLADRYRTGGSRPPGLVVATQVVEVSLDIDLDALYTAAAPLEALLQRFGRVNRRGTRPPADVVICSPAYGPRRGNPAGPEYADGVYEAEPVRLGWDILNRFDGQLVPEADATAWLDEIYGGIWGQRWRAEVTEARDTFRSLFLTFIAPFDSREHLEERFDEMFNGTEAILTSDYDAYATALREHSDRAGRLLGESYLIPLPEWAINVAAYDKQLRVRVIDGEYDDERGLLSAKPVRGTAVYQPGEVL